MLFSLGKFRASRGMRCVFWLPYGEEEELPTSIIAVPALLSQNVHLVFMSSAEVNDNSISGASTA